MCRTRYIKLTSIVSALGHKPVGRLCFRKLSIDSWVLTAVAGLLIVCCLPTVLAERIKRSSA
ncbi:hypothetical protein BDR07DRAFT_1424942 [Suillus spraguei]|nr:hypothetical protein BDR07DRAFT_1424942 [Suillus spraguei]